MAEHNDQNRPFVGRLLIGCVFVIIGVAGVFDRFVSINPAGVLAVALVVSGLAAITVQVSRRAPADDLGPN